MLNYIWAGLIVSSLLFALWFDVGDERHDTYRNGDTLPATLIYADAPPEAGQDAVEVVVVFDIEVVATHYDIDLNDEDMKEEERDAWDAMGEPHHGTIEITDKGTELRFAPGTLPEPLATMVSKNLTHDDDAIVRVDSSKETTGEEGIVTASVGLAFEKPARFLKMQDITQAAFDYAGVAVTLSLGLIGVLALWMGLLKIAEEAGLVGALVKVVQPLIRPLFPEIPKDHPALGMIALNLTANILALGNAATPMGLKAMEEMQKLNPKKDTATNSMVMFLAMNTASVQLVPSATIIAIMGLQAADLVIAIILVTALSLTFAVVICKLFERLPWYRNSSPGVLVEAAGDEIPPDVT